MLLRSLFEFLLPPWDLNPFQANVVLKAPPPHPLLPPQPWNELILYWLCVPLWDLKRLCWTLLERIGNFLFTAILLEYEHCYFTLKTASPTRFFSKIPLTANIYCKQYLSFYIIFCIFVARLHVDPILFCFCMMKKVYYIAVKFLTQMKT